MVANGTCARGKNIIAGYLDELVGRTHCSLGELDVNGEPAYCKRDVCNGVSSLIGIVLL